MTDTEEIIKASGLVYMTDQTPGFYRRGGPGRFYYVNRDGAQIRDEKVLDRINKLVLPPAWTSVWISPKANSHLQATGIDAASRKQYKYHPSWIKRRSERKYFRLLDFGRALPKARKKLEKDLLRPNLDERKVLAICVDLLQKTLLRVGDKSYLRHYNSVGLSTLKDKHAKINGSSLQLSFVGKKGVPHKVKLTDRKLTSLVKKCREIPGQALFQYYTQEGETKSVDSGQINNYIKEITGDDFTAKDFRTWGGTLEALRQFAVCHHAGDERPKSKIEVHVLDCVAKKLGNTRAVCKNSYVYPLLLEAYKDDSLMKWLKKMNTEGRQTKASLENDERVLLSFLRKHAKHSDQ